MAFKKITVRGAREHNLKNINVEIPKDELVVITGLSGSGKSSLINEILYKSLAATLNRAKTRSGEHDEILGVENLDKVIDINQSPIGIVTVHKPDPFTAGFCHAPQPG